MLKSLQTSSKLSEKKKKKKNEMRKAEKIIRELPFNYFKGWVDIFFYNNMILSFYWYIMQSAQNLPNPGFFSGKKIGPVFLFLFVVCLYSKYLCLKW